MKILVVGPSKTTRGGVTSVITAHQNFSFWKNNNCMWIESYDDFNNINKIKYFLKSIVQYLININSSDTVYIHIALGTSAIRKFFFFIIAKIFNKKVILHFHTPGNAKEIPKDIWKVKFMFKNSSKVVVLSKGWKEMIFKEFKISNIRCIENPSPSQPSNIKKGNYILFMGTLSERKGYKDLLIAFSKIKNDFTDWKIELCGNGDLGRVKNLISDLELSNNVIVNGWVNEKERYEAFSRAAIFCLPSYAEGLPVAVLEGLSYKCVILTTPVGGIPDYFESEENSILIQPGDIDGLSKALKRLMKDEILRQKLVQNSEKVYKYFNPNLIDSKMTNLFNEL